jgi:mRNA-degrading endonuclease toxin of MazEF toxin-antitoxin module
MMRSTTSLIRGDVVLIGFQFEAAPGSSLIEVKDRPALIVSSDWYHSGRQELVLVAVTSNQARPILPGEVRIAQWAQAGLRKPSTVTMILRTVKQAAVRRRLGRMDPVDFSSVENALRRALGL